MTASGLDAPRETTAPLMHISCTAAMTAWSSLARSVFVRYLRSSRSVMHVMHTLSCNIPDTL